MDEALRDRTEGRARTGFVNLRSFDEGVVETLGARIDEETENYFLNLEEVETVGFDPPVSSHFHRGPVDPRPGLPAIPVTFAYPEDVFEKYSIPMILVRRDDISPALQRWHPGTLQYRAPGRGAHPSEYKQYQTSDPVKGYDRVEQVDQAAPFDLSYTINIVARNRGAPGVRNQANRVLDHVLRIYQPYCRVLLKDSVGDARSYSAFMEGISHLDEVADVTDRVIGFAVTLRIEGELDLNDPVIRKTVTRALTLRSEGL
jgi:hypothetical protein